MLPPLSRSGRFSVVLVAGPSPPDRLAVDASPDRRLYDLPAKTGAAPAVLRSVFIISSSCALRFSSSSRSRSAFFLASRSRRCLMISVGVRTPLLGYCGTGPGPGAAREPLCCVRPLVTGADTRPPPARSDIEAFSSIRSGVKRNGVRMASSRAYKIAEAVRREICVFRRGQ